ncbi:MAG: hypothetical protein ABJB47_12175 [Actinomycetota bacterium]
MTLHPDEQSALDLMDTTLGAGEPHLAAMFTIFTRLTAGEGMPPDEDRIPAVLPPGPPPKSRRRPLGRRRATGGGRPVGRGLPTGRRRPMGRRRPVGRTTAGRRLSRPLRIILVPAALLLVLALIVVASLAGTARCAVGRSARSAPATSYIPLARACSLPKAAQSPGGK